MANYVKDADEPNIRFEATHSKSPHLCWFCPTIISANTEHVAVDIESHPLRYRTHRTCIYQFVGGFALFAYSDQNAAAVG